MKLIRPVLIAGVVAPALIWGSQNTTTGLTWLLGCLLGWLLIHFQFGFSGPIRRTITTRNPQAMAPIAVLVIALILGSTVAISLARVFDLALELPAAPLRPSLLAGAFLFGAGMQMAGRCSSGTLASANHPDSRFSTTLIGLILGSFFASLHRPTIEKITPAGWGPVNLVDLVPLWLAVVIQLAILTLLLLLLQLWCSKRGEVTTTTSPLPVPGRTIVAALGLAAAMLLYLLVTGETWKVLWGLTVSGAHLAHSLSWEPSTSEFWSTPKRLTMLATPLNWIQHPAVVVNLAVIYGAVLAGLRKPTASTPSGGKRGPILLLPYASGGLLMGYGGFLSYGCNISSFLGGVISFSLHGWAWLIAAFLGSYAWIKIRDLPPV